ncbi:DUF427 domain-containing protein [Pendulispora brunnea]|uniref:DUF427 domain-containing protein n=1 Tax=Pendulispora brunnea TaxID=2905690 RepID=A0ABZ2KJM0_9BACT
MAGNSGPGYAKHPEHRVEAQREAKRVRVTFQGEIIADTENAIRLEEGTYPAVYYVPREDVKMDRLVRTEHHTECPFKGKASYFSLGDAKKGELVENAVWTYEHPYDEVAVIKDHVAFYPNKVDAISIG